MRALGKQQVLELALLNLGDSYLRTRDFAESLKYSSRAAILAACLCEPNQRDDEQITLFNRGSCYIGSAWSIAGGICGLLRAQKGCFVLVVRGAINDARAAEAVCALGGVLLRRRVVCLYRLWRS